MGSFLSREARAALAAASVIATAAAWLGACSGSGTQTGPDDAGDAGGKDGTSLDGPVTDAFAWPDCNTTPASAKVEAIPQVWADNPSKPVETWITGAYVAAVSKGGCAANEACDFYVQTDPSYASLQAAALHGLKVFVSAASAQHFVGLAVGDKVDLLGWAWRYDVGGQNELLLQVNETLPGCFKKTGSATLAPVTAMLTDFSVMAAEETLGPVLVEVDGVSGTPQNPGETFGIYKTGTYNDAGVQSVTSLSPYFLAGGVFTGLTKGQKTNFTRVVGVFGLFVPPADGGATAKYMEIYPRTSADIVQ